MSIKTHPLLLFASLNLITSIKAQETSKSNAAMLLRFIISALISLVPLIAADYHIAEVDFFSIDAGESTDYVACASNNYNCGCFVGNGFSSNGDGVIEDTNGADDTLGSFFILIGDGFGDFCGIPQ